MGNRLYKLQIDAQAEILGKINGPQIELSGPEPREDVTLISATQLQNMIFSGEIGTPDVVKLFHLKKQEEQNKSRAMTDVFYEGPLDKATEWHSKINKISKAEAPLLGFVMTVKDNMFLENTRVTAGVVANYRHVWKKPVPLMDYFQKKGALITSKGNVPQLLLAIESSNNIFGECTNPLDHTRSPGGSSGGDAASICMGLANASISSDVAGSLRIPASFCGLTTIKVTAGRFDSSCNAGCILGNPDAFTIPDVSTIYPSVIGPITRCVADLETFMRVWNDFNQVNFHLPPLEWRKPKLKKRVGVFKEFELFEQTPTNRRALEESVETFKRLGYEVVEIDLNDIAEDLITHTLASLFRNTLIRDMLLRKHHMEEPLMEYYKLMATLHKAPTFLVKLISRFMPRRKQIFTNAMILSRQFNNIYFLNKMAVFRKHVHDIFVAKNIDFALMHSYPPAQKLGLTQKTSLVVIYTVLWNYLDFPAGTLPVTTVREDEQFYQSKHVDDITDTMRLNAENSKGLPVSVQVISLPFREEEVVEGMRILETESKFLETFKYGINKKADEVER